VHAFAEMLTVAWASAFDYYADLADTFPFEEEVTPWMGEFGLIVHEPAGVVGAIIPWNAPPAMITYKVAPALIAGCTVVLKCSPEAPGEGYILAEIAQGDRTAGGRAERGHRRS
jgi:aldehyde dehydrogenase (NAD+)